MEVIATFHRRECRSREDGGGAARIQGGGGLAMSSMRVSTTTSPA